jgi:hypothetical protein
MPMSPDEASSGNVDRALDDFVAEVTVAAYSVALRHRAGDEWLDLEMDIWKVLDETIKKQCRQARLPCLGGK